MNAQLFFKLAALGLLACVPLTGESFYVELFAKTLVLAIFANFVLMLFSRPFSKLFQKLHLVGPLIRITGLIVSAVAVQMILDGAGEWLSNTLR